ncbi:Ger(x)C family spore germination protein [Metabacillus malikii]|uniref:Ger(X)C family germination protein n=1 Tax=Metabacillus malikii TaxID=1504265 RepID=A0ABT9ZK36_9BACI|nr:Ger(x)C family spore germination protein [Metabacillus malikii]MDQ0232662.1 Ger(x)C family germination protein [Metabacillus malikii]
MIKQRKIYVLVTIIICLACLVGCTRTRIIDKISIVHVFGFDLGENGQLKGTALIPQYTMSKNSDEIKLIEEEAVSGDLFVPKMSRHTSTPIEMGKIRVMLFGKNYAEAGIKDMVERFLINPQVGTNIQIAISTDSARETLKTFKKEKSLTLADTLKHNMEGAGLPNSNLHIFLNHFYGKGMDAFVPMITIKEDKIVVEGVGIFKDDKLKLQLSPDESILLSFLIDKRSEGTYTMEDSDHNRTELISVQNFKSDSKWRWEKGKLDLRFQLKMTLTQFPDRFDIKKVEDVMKITKKVEDKLEKDIADLLTTFQEEEVDPIGIGNIVRSKDRSWKREAFYEQYPSIPIDVNVDVEIIHAGLEG